MLSQSILVKEQPNEDLFKIRVGAPNPSVYLSIEMTKLVEKCAVEVSELKEKHDRDVIQVRMQCASDTAKQVTGVCSTEVNRCLHELGAWLTRG